MNDAAEEALGLTSEEVQMRIAAGEVNVDAGVKTRSVGQIVHDNICTLFNLVNAVLALIVLFTGSYKNMLFMVVIVCNTVIGIVQEVRSKRITDKLSIIAGTKSHTLRDSAEVELPLDQLVRDDVVVLRRGDQVPADAQIVSGECRVNESLLTGEGDLIRKQPGDALMSGSFINSGMVYARVVHVGAENYAAKISAEAKERKAVRSEIMRCLNGIIEFVSCIMFPLGALLFARDYFWGNSELNSAILSTVSALVGMIPEGLILLTSTVLAFPSCVCRKARCWFNSCIALKRLLVWMCFAWTKRGPSQRAIWRLLGCIPSKAWQLRMPQRCLSVKRAVRCAPLRVGMMTLTRLLERLPHTSRTLKDAPKRVCA